ncbi:MAG: HAMP domain-containing histidine kinase [Bergeyella sp.]|nr:HAMP domain-containing histidine kinase [Bergeyella sp.]
MALFSLESINLRYKIFWSFLFICILSIFCSTILSYLILRNNTLMQSKIEQQNKVASIMSALDYALSSTRITTEDLPKVLENKIYEIADVSKSDLIIYDLEGNYLTSNKAPNLVAQKKVKSPILKLVLDGVKRVDVDSYDKSIDANKTSSYMLLTNNIWEPIGVVYLPYFHTDSTYFAVLNRYVKYILVINLLIVLLSVLISWIISNHLSKVVSRFSQMVNKITLFDKDLKPIRYYQNDELSPLVKSYNKMILQIQDQKERLRFIEKEDAWREMAKQVAHEVKNPLTPMKLTIQNFERKFDARDPEIYDKVKKMSATVIDQINLIASVANAFSQFAQLPQKNNETFDLGEEIESIVQIFAGEKIAVRGNMNKIMIHMDKIFLNRIIVNLVTNAKQAASQDRELMIVVDIEKISKRIKISVEDNGKGIPKNMIKRIFEPNFTSKNSGMGLGLSMVRKMIEDYGGDITVQSEENVGTCFTIFLPSNI